MSQRLGAGTAPQRHRDAQRCTEKGRKGEDRRQEIHPPQSPSLCFSNLLCVHLVGESDSCPEKNRAVSNLFFSAFLCVSLCLSVPLWFRSLPERLPCDARA